MWPTAAQWLAPMVTLKRAGLRWDLLGVFASALAWVGACSAAERPNNPVIVGVDTTAAWDHRLSEPRPIRTGGASGRKRVKLTITVGPDGQVKAVKALSDSPRRWRRAAETQARSWTYRRFLVDGKAVTVSYSDSIAVLPEEDLPKVHQPFPATDPVMAVITLRRTGCFGTCPDYALTISGDGRVTYTGERFVSVVGPLHYTIRPQKALALVQKFKRGDFYSLKNEYRYPVTDNPTTIIAISVGGQEKKIVDYEGARLGMPQSVTDLERAVDEAAEVRHWVRGDGDTLMQLKRLGWDFRSREAGASLIQAMAHASDDYLLGLIDAGAPLDVVFEHSTALEAAAWKGRSKVVSALLRAGAAKKGPVGTLDEALRQAASSGSLNTLKEVMRGRPDVNAQRQDEMGGSTALIIAASSPRYDQETAQERREGIEAVRLLLAAGADPKLRDSRGATALHYAANADIVGLLLQRGAKFDARDETGATPLLTVPDEGAALALLEAGADANVKPEFGRPLAERAKEFGWKRVRARLKR